MRRDRPAVLLVIAVLALIIVLPFALDAGIDWLWD
jgi:preprotein translocase subunit SecE